MNPRSEEIYQLFHNGILALAQAERNGFRIDMEYIQRKKKQLSKRIEILERKFMNSKFYREWKHSKKGKSPNIYSNHQLAHFLYDIKKIKPVLTTGSGQGSTNEEALKQLNIPELNLLLEIRKLRKLRDTYLENFSREQVNGYIHPFFNLHLVRTGRSSSDSPNFQNIPKRDKESMRIIRKALYPRPGHQLMEVDYGQLEVRISVTYHHDPTLERYLTDPRADMHRDMAKQIFFLKEFNPTIPGHTLLRQAAKNGFVFPQFYGDYYINCAYNLACNWGKLPVGRWKPKQGIEFEDGFLSDHLIRHGVKSLKSFEDHIQDIEDDFWNKRFPVYKKWKEKWWNLYQKYGYIDLHTGFRCSGVMGKNDISNYPVQGTAFHCLLWSFIELDKELRKKGYDTRLIGQIHDSIILDVNPTELERVYLLTREITTERLPKAWNWITVPLEVDFELSDVDKSWADKKEFLIG